MLVRFVEIKQKKEVNGLPHTTKVVCIRPNDFMKKVKQIMILYNDGSSKWYNLNAFLSVFQHKLMEWLKQRGFKDEI